MIPVTTQEQFDGNDARPFAVRRVIISILIIHTLMLIVTAWLHSPAIDEVGHLPAGLVTWKLGRYDVYSVNPPLMRMAAALPLHLLTYNESWGFIQDQMPEDAFKGKGMNAVRQIQWVIIAACLAQLGQQPTFGQVSSRDWLAELKRATTSMSKEFANSSGHSEIVTTLPLQNREEKKVVLFGRMGTSQISANFAAEPGLVTDANKVAVVTDGVCFWIERDDADPFRVMGITTRAADTDGYYDAVVQNGAGGTFGALGSSVFSLPKDLSDGYLVFREAVVESANCVRFTFSIPALEMTAEVLFDFAIPGVLEIDTWEKADGSAFREEHRVTYTGNGKGTGSIPESVANNHFYNKELRIGTQTRVLDFEFEAPDPSVFDIRTYGIAGPALPSERTVPRWLMAVIAILVGCGAYVIRRRAIAARNLS